MTQFKVKMGKIPLKILKILTIYGLDIYQE